MKRIKYIGFGLLSSFAFVGAVNAAPSYSLTTSSSTVENGKSVTASLTLRNTASWNVKIISAGNTSGCSTQNFADATSNGGNTTKTFSVTCKATSLGLISFTISGDVTSSDGTNINISGSKTVTVVEPRKASTNNNLKSLSVEGYELTPSFDADVLEYSVTVPSTVNEVKIDAAKADQYASLEGTGTFEVNEGINPFEIVVTSETGIAKTYKVNVNVEDINPIVIKIDGQEYTLVKNAKNIEAPTLFTESKLTIDDLEVPAYISDVSEFTLVAVRDKDGKVFFAIKDNNEYYLYRTITLGNTILYIIDKEFESKYFESAKLTIGDYEVNAYKLIKDDNYYLIYGKNIETNEENWYKYDAKEKTIQRYENNIEEELNKTIKDYFMVIIIFGSVTVLSVIVAVVSIIIGNKRVKKVLDYISTKQQPKKEPVKDINLEQTKEFKKETVKTKKVDLNVDTIEVPTTKKKGKKK